MISIMSRTVILMLGLITLAAAAHIPGDGVTEPNCSQYFLPICTREYEPVCGTNGAEFSNECMLCLHNMEAKGRQSKILMRSKGPC